jgi:hypothetical protein
MEQTKRKCPKCDAVLSDEWIVRQAMSIQGSTKSKRRAAASKKNGKLGGRPPKSKTLKLADQDEQ